MLAGLAAEEEFELWEENVDAVGAFLKVQTQWRSGPAGITGLDYNGVLAAFTLLGIAHTPELFGKIQIMERAVLNLRNEANK